MLNKKALSLLVTASLGIAALTGCGNNSGASGDSSNKVIKIASQSPLSGGSATLGDALKNGSELALNEEKDKFKELGYTLQFEPLDDQGDPKKGVANAEQIGSDSDVYGIIGHLNSGVTIPSSEVYEKYNIPMISPAATATDVTDRGLKTANRIVARDDFQGPAGAQFAMETLKVNKIFIIQDKTAYGQGLAENFKGKAEELGAEIIGEEGITVGEKDFNGVLSQVASVKPDLVYFGGLYAEGGLLIKQAREKGITAKFMGGDGLDSSSLVDIAGDAVKDTYITSVAGVSTDTKFAKNYKEKFNKDAESYSIYGYDSMKVMLLGIENAIKENDGEIPAKDVVAKAVRSVSDYKGEMTEVGFDEKGDNKFAKIFIYKFAEAAYPPKLEGEISK
ncbi:MULTISPECIES: branched-chain amino acid ABC transporter substrate-binding protein [Bacillus]|uniref:ABC transporter substrate-binding protein n=2 Tax=Bacillus TaxID=1386 RepID=A0A0M4FP77_9BACI|nr:MULTISPECIES: branched-chain amino acid ABC transporter substrate-binding protein [Bacillus]ALC80810.1 ABC transporter substrate-binding protein [Bacillus gobiensis]MBP1079730.1 branched-chain amino acid transport system substrate-binding protein [Bacillus capparidis]MED1095126.1 branched-chain amino acid ABC transporter substrate-binding protein [Bacillus capparidis]